jgi:RNA polymerase sigma-70 factor (ECF subfamily)
MARPSEGPWAEKPVLHRAIAELPDKQRAVVVLRLIEGFSYEEISTVLNLSESNVQLSVIQALRKVKEILTSET